LWSILFCSIFSSFEQIPFEEKVLGADPPSRGYGVAGEAAPSNIVLIIHAMLQAGGTHFVVSQTSVACTQTTSNRR
jgi:hypothetical protein